MKSEKHIPEHDPNITDGDTDRYCTPDDIMDMVYSVLGGYPDLDPFADPTSNVQAHERWDIREGKDAYERLWPGNGAKIFVNGPFSQCAKWLAFCHEAHSRKATLVAVCRAATNSEYWKQYVFGSTSRCFPCPRISFDWNLDKFTSPREDHAVLCYSHDSGIHASFLDKFRLRGHMESDVGGSLPERRIERELLANLRAFIDMGAK